MYGAFICLIILGIVFILVVIASDDEVRYHKTEKPTQPNNKNVVDTPKPSKTTIPRYIIDISGKKMLIRINYVVYC